MIEIRQKGDLFEDNSEALVNAVNTEGVMGKGIALRFKELYPEMYEAYRKACKASKIKLGHVHVYETGKNIDPKYIINFPTKSSWREPSRLEYIQSGLQSLVSEVKNRGIHSISMPALGCGLGGLNWNNVRNMIYHAFEGIPNVKVFLYSPQISHTKKGGNMNIKGDFQSRQVLIGNTPLEITSSQRLKNHSTEYNWGYGGSGPAQLALALILHYSKDADFTLRNYQDFKWEVITKLPNASFEIDESIILDWIQLKKKMEISKNENILSQCALEVENDPDLNKDMGTWDLTTGDGLEHES